VLAYPRQLERLAPHVLKQLRIPSALRGRLYWLPLPLSVSEREPFIVVEKAAAHNAALRRALGALGWIELPWEQMSVGRLMTASSDSLHFHPSAHRPLLQVWVDLVCSSA
jgi:hypothetical protein